MKMKRKTVEDLIFKSYLEEVLKKKKYLKMNRYIQHGNTTCLLHSIAVAYYSYRLACFLRLNVHERELIRGALLHDYFLYDWHYKYRKSRNLGKHGTIHPRIALYNAKKDFNINHLEEEIIKNHMFPLTFIPPKHKESVLVCIVDKICSIYEVFSKNSYEKVTNKVVNAKKTRRIVARRVNI